MLMAAVWSGRIAKPRPFLFIKASRQDLRTAEEVFIEIQLLPRNNNNSEAFIIYSKNFSNTKMSDSHKGNRSFKEQRLFILFIYMGDRNISIIYPFHLHGR